MSEYSHAIDCDGNVDQSSALIEVIAIGEPAVPAYLSFLRLEVSSSLVRRAGFYRLEPSPVVADAHSVWFVNGGNLGFRGLDRRDPVVRRVYGGIGVSVEDPSYAHNPSPVEVMAMSKRSVRHGFRLDVMDFELHKAPDGSPLSLRRRGANITRPDLLDLRSALVTLMGSTHNDQGGSRDWLISKILPALETAEELASEA